MTKSFKSLRQKMSKRAQASAENKTRALLKQMLLQDLRQALDISQENMADRLSTKQANISRIERRKDMYVSTLRNYIEAMGGQLDIIARFPQGEVHINQFDELETKA